MNNPPTIGLSMIMIAQRYIQNTLILKEGQALGLLFFGMSSIIGTSQGETNLTFQQLFEQRIQAARQRLNLERGDVLPRSTGERTH